VTAAAGAAAAPAAEQQPCLRDAYTAQRRSLMHHCREALQIVARPPPGPRRAPTSSACAMCGRCP
jgi:hypothetical protein